MLFITPSKNLLTILFRFANEETSMFLLEKLKIHHSDTSLEAHIVIPSPIPYRRIVILADTRILSQVLNGLQSGKPTAELHRPLVAFSDSYLKDIRTVVCLPCEEARAVFP